MSILYQRKIYKGDLRYSPAGSDTASNVGPTRPVHDDTKKEKKPFKYTHINNFESTQNDFIVLILFEMRHLRTECTLADINKRTTQEHFEFLQQSSRSCD